MFSAPFDPRDDTAYIPTQYLAERIKGAGLAGIIYDSALSPNGYNVTLFNKSSAEPMRRKLAQAHQVRREIKSNVVYAEIRQRPLQPELRLGTLPP
jgi:hypothetical protein